MVSIDQPTAPAALAEQLRAVADGGAGRRDFAGADLRGAELAGLHLAQVSLAGARLDGADLSRAALRQVDLSRASLRGARLDGASFEQVRAGALVLEQARAEDSRWELSDLTGADLAGAALGRAVFRCCTLERARLNDADLSQSMIVHSLCDGAVLTGALLAESTTLGSSFREAELAGARRFFGCREIIAELLRREAGEDPERLGLVGVVTLYPRWCYPEWARFLARRPAVRDLALAIFSRYPESGCAEALRDARAARLKAADR